MYLKLNEVQDRMYGRRLHLSKLATTRLRYVLRNNAHTTYVQKDVCVTGSHDEENLSNWSMIMERCALRKIMMRHDMNK